jgi:putative ABC transport system permease protein
VVTSLVWLSSRRNLGWRRRRFVIAVAGTTLAFALTLLLSGFRDGIDVEATRTVRALGGDLFVVKDGVSGPFTTIAQVPAEVAVTLASGPGVRRADPVVSVRHAIESSPVTDVYLVGTRPGGLGMPRVSAGRAPLGRGEAVLDTRAHRHVGDRIRLGGEEFDVVGLVDKVSVWAGVPAMFVTLPDAQDLVFGGLPSATTILVRGRPAQLPPGLRSLDARQARADLERPLANAITTIDLLRILLWVVAAAIVGSVLYISALERSRDFAVFKAFGTDTGDLVGTLVVEAVALSAVSAAAAAGLSRVLSGLFPAVISFPARTLLLLPVVALVIGVVGSLAGARRAISVDPALAFASQ